MRPRTGVGGIWLVVLCALALALGAAPAQAYRPLLSEEALHTVAGPNPLPPPEGQLEDPCGLAIAPGGNIYVSDYYHRAVDVFSSGGTYSSQILLPGGPFTGLGINELDSVCGLAFGSGGELYANELHEGVLRLKPSETVFDTGESTGVAIDAAGNVFVDDRTRVTVYEPSGEPVEVGGEPLVIGEGALLDAYGLAVSASGERVYVADAATGNVKVFEPSGNPATPVATISPPAGFTSLTDAALAIDPSNGHLLVLDNRQPLYESPEAVVDEFDAASGALLGQLNGSPGQPIIDGEPSGLAADSSGNLYVTSGNSEGANVFKFGPYSVAPPPSSALGAGSAVSSAQTAAAGPAAAAPTTTTTGAASRRRGGASASEVIQRGNVRVSVGAAIAPRRLPRHGAAPIHFSLSAGIASTDGSVPPQLRRISVEINRNGQIHTAGLPLCRIDQIQPSTTGGALAACRSSLIGEGRFSAKVLIAQQAPFPSEGKIVAFNGRWHGRPAILAHVYGSSPVPTSYTLPFVIGAIGKGTYGTSLSASLPRFTSKWGYVTGISLNLGASFVSHGAHHSYLTAGCPAPKGFPGAVFPLSRATLSFGGKPISQTLTRSCSAH